MSILHSVTLPNGAEASFHKVVRLDVRPDACEAVVHSWPSFDRFAEGGPIIWQSGYEVPHAALSADPYATVEVWLVGPAGPLSGGQVSTADEALPAAAARKLSELRHARNLTEFGGFDAPGLGRFSSDAMSQTRIVGAVVASRLEATQPFLLSWTRQDDSSVDLTGDDLERVGLSLLAHLDAVHSRWRQVRADVLAAETVEAVNAITWSE